MQDTTGLDASVRFSIDELCDSNVPFPTSNTLFMRVIELDVVRVTDIRTIIPVDVMETRGELERSHSRMTER